MSSEGPPPPPYPQYSRVGKSTTTEGRQRRRREEEEEGGNMDEEQVVEPSGEEVEEEEEEGGEDYQPPLLPPCLAGLLDGGDGMSSDEEEEEEEEESTAADETPPTPPPPPPPPPSPPIVVDYGPTLATLLGDGVIGIDEEGQRRGSLDWTAIHARIRSHPHEAGEAIGTTTALHVIVESIPSPVGEENDDVAPVLNNNNGPPTIALVQDAVEAYPDALGATNRPDVAGVTPLYLSMFSDRLDIIDLLARRTNDKFPRNGLTMRDRYGGTAYHIANNPEKLEILARCDPRGLHMKDYEGKIPLLYQLGHTTMDLRTLRLFLDYGWEREEGMWSEFDEGGAISSTRAGVLVPDEKGDTALSKAVELWHTRFQDRVVDRQQDQDEEEVDVDDNDSAYSLRVMREVCIAGYAAKVGLDRIDYDGIPLLCSFLSHLPDLDPDECAGIVYTVLDIEGRHATDNDDEEEVGVGVGVEEELAGTKVVVVDRNTGRTPLHILAEWGGEAMQNKWDVPSIVQEILKFPGGKESASMVNNGGMLPLQVGAVSGLDSESMKCIAEAEVRAVRTRDWKTGLLPFHLAAVEGKSLDSAYNLLREVADIALPDPPSLPPSV